ncbi:Smr/MutS family protein [Mailhella sp.]|uniref:Smr/MutS family protein n=1 Tax=Mailhella sp. TaxID=1981029 RepID=UPI004064284D
MSKDPSNPFAALNARDFPSRNERGNPQKARAKASGGKTVVKDKAAARDKAEAELDADAEMFMNALGGDFRSLPPKENSPARTPAKAKKASSGRSVTPAPGRPALSAAEADKAAPAAAEAPSNVDPDNPFARALKSESVKRMVQKDAPAPAPVKEEPAAPAEEDDAPSTLTGMARAAARIGRRTDASLLAEAAGAPSDADDSRDFFSAIKGTTPLAGSGRDIPVEPAAPPVPVHDPRHPLQDFMEGKVEFSVAATAEYAEGHVLGLDLSIVGQLQARQFSPEAHIDLHGLNSEQAFSNLVNFFRSSYYKGVRVALVVTGRGLNSLNGVPVLRAKVQEWFTHDPFKRVVLAFCTAKQEDGGAGAFYVLLRKYKKNAGKIRWDAMPSDPDLFL